MLEEFLEHRLSHLEHRLQMLWDSGTADVKTDTVSTPSYRDHHAMMSWGDGSRFRRQFVGVSENGTPNIPQHEFIYA